MDNNTICVQMFTHVQLYHFHFRTVNTFIFRMAKCHHFEGKDNWVAFTHRNVQWRLLGTKRDNEILL